MTSGAVDAKATVRSGQLIEFATATGRPAKPARSGADRIAAVFVPCVISLAAATLGFWLGAGRAGASA